MRGDAFEQFQRAAGPVPWSGARMSENDVLAHVAVIDAGFGIKDRENNF